MSDCEPTAALPDSVLRQLDEVESVLAGAEIRVRKQPSLQGTLHEIDLWADQPELLRLERALTRIGFEPFRAARQDDHRFFLWAGDGYWIKVDVKLPEHGRSTLAGDVWWLAQRRRGLVMALLGADGAGKSTAASCIQSSMPIDVKLRYLGIRKRRGARADGGSSRQVGEAKRKTVGPARQFAGLVKWLLTVTVATWSMELSARRGSVVVCDRHPIEAGLLGDEPPIVKRVKRIAVRRLLPRPHLVALLAAPGEILYARKHEHTPDILDEMTDTWRGVCEAFGGVEIDASLEAGVVCWELQQQIWGRLEDRRSP
jgi:hypothetical protein